MRFRLVTIFLLCAIGTHLIAEEALVLIGHNTLPKTDISTIQRLYSGRVVSLGQHPATPINLLPGDPLRQQFLSLYLAQSEEQYTGYWLVRRYVGKGTPPLEAATINEIIRIVESTPGAVGYVPLSRVPNGANIIFRR